jgi:hypothetical protein
MKRGTKFLARSGIVAAVSAALISTSMAQAAVSSPSGLPGLGVDQTPAQSVPDEPLEERVKQAIEEINQKGQTALAERILKMMEQATREVKQRLHSRVSDRFEELNDLAIARMHYQAQTEL